MYKRDEGKGAGTGSKAVTEWNGLWLVVYLLMTLKNCRVHARGGTVDFERLRMSMR